MQDLLSSIRRNTLGIAIFAAVTAGLIAITQVLTQERIAANREAHQARALYEILPQQLDPNLHLQVLEVQAPELGMTQPIKVFQSIVDGRVEAVILPVTTADGYSGDINILVGIWRDGRVAGVRVIGHRETPGLGDKIELDKSDWILSFNEQRWLGEDDSRWRVRKDGGQFDQFTGATITPRAIVAEIKRALLFFEAEQPTLLYPVRLPDAVGSVTAQQGVEEHD